SSRARNRSPDPVVSCFFGRIAPSGAATESCFSIRGNRENEFASFHGLRHGNLAISSQQSRQKTTLAQRVINSSRATIYLNAFRKFPEEGGSVTGQAIDGWGAGVSGRKRYQLFSIERSCNVAPLSKCSMKIWPMLRVQAIAVTEETTSPMRAPDGTTKKSVDVVTAANPVGTVPPTRPTMMARARSRSNGTP